VKEEGLRSLAEGEVNGTLGDIFDMLTNRAR
jgi:hypothetical protein